MLIALRNVCFGYEDKHILENITVEVQEGDKIGLVGANGEGKTTLLNLITGGLICDKGEISSKKGLNIGYLRQNTGLSSGLSVYDEMKRVYAHLANMEKALRQKELALAEIKDHEGAEYRIKAAEYVALTTAFEAADGYNIDVKIKTVLNGMGFGGRYEQIVDKLSGGEKTRLALCKLLLEEPELLILDEPTNHLDFDALMWLGKYLESYKGALLTVSHDRYFLDKTTSKIWDLENKRIEIYNGNYTKYRQLKKERIDRQIKEYEKQKNKIESMTEYAERNIARASTSNSAKSRLHQLANMERIEKPITYRKQAVFKFDFERESVKEALFVKNLKLQVPGKVLVDKIDFGVTRGDRLAIVGKNGTGKSTLIKTIAGINESYGSIFWGKNVKTSYYDQENLNLDVTHTVLEELWFKNHKLSQTEVRSMLARMLLFAEDIEKKVAVLSGGEKAKLSFALTMSQKGNFLLLDEPTNHLDLDTREALEEGLKDFGGTMIFVSHDLYFLNRLATRVLEIDNGKAELYECGFEEYWESKSAKESVKEQLPQKKAVVAETESVGYRSAKQRAEEVQRKRKIADTEKEIAQLEGRSGEIDELMTTSEYTSDYKKLAEICTEQERIKERLTELYEKWEMLNE